jgi:hypothetical protein
METDTHEPRPHKSRWRGLFPDGPFTLPFGVRRGRAEDWLALDRGRPERLAERARWLAEAPARHAFSSPAASPLLAALTTRLGLDADTSIAALGACWEPDCLLLAPDGAGEMRFTGGAVCFPSAWAPEEKFGRPVAEIHAPVPGLNTQLGGRIRDYLARVPAGVVGERENWGLAATDALNLHPALAPPRPGPDARLETTWLRVERQAFLPLPEAGGLAFLIGIELERLDELARDAVAAAGLARHLASLPADMAAYKGLAAARLALLRQLTA